MRDVPLHKPLMPPWFLCWADGPDQHGEDTLHITSWRRNLTLKGTSFAEFESQVLSLLDGQRSMDEICDRVRGAFAKNDVINALEMLAMQGIVQEAASGSLLAPSDRLGAQKGWFSEISQQGQAAQDKLAQAHVVLFGAGQQGAVVARSLVAAGVGTLTVVDPAEVSATDPYFAGVFRASDIGRNRAQALCDALTLPDNTTVLHSVVERPERSDDIAALLKQSTLALCCLESGELRLALNLNRACLALNLPWIAASLEGTEVVVGPGFRTPRDSACYQCWRTREIAASSKPEARFALEQYLETAETDFSPRRENLAAAADVAGGLLAAEALNWLTDVGHPALDARFMTITLPSLRVEKHVVLRKPGCPACSEFAS